MFYVSFMLSAAQVWVSQQHLFNRITGLGHVEECRAYPKPPFHHSPGCRTFCGQIFSPGFLLPTPALFPL